MKTMFENMISLIVMMILVFVFTGIISLETQVINARNIHSRVIELYQNSNHTLSPQYFNNCISNGEVTFSSNDNNETEVIYTYNVSIPFININDEYRIVGFAK